MNYKVSLQRKEHAEIDKHERKKNDRQIYVYAASAVRVILVNLLKSAFLTTKYIPTLVDNNIGKGKSKKERETEETKMRKL